MATPLRAVHSSLSSSSRVGIRLRRNATATASRRAQLWVPSSCSTSETRPIVSAASCSISDGLMLSTAERRPTRATGRGNTQTPRAALRLFSAVAPLFEDTIIVTKRCAERLNELRISKGQPELRLRLTVEGGGCSGFQYRFALEDAASGGGGGAAAREAEDEEDSDDEDDADVDHKFERDGAVLIVDDTSLGFVKGATVDFEEDMMRSAFAVLNNPVSESACGCGSSFAIKNFEKNPALD